MQPIVCILSLKEGENFDPSIKEGFYETIGGNNSHEAYKQLLEEQPKLKKNRVFTHRLCSVYSKMDRKLALRLASKHNRATAFYLETSTWDKVCKIYFIIILTIMCVATQVCVCSYLCLCVWCLCTLL